MYSVSLWFKNKKQNKTGERKKKGEGRGKGRKEESCSQLIEKTLYMPI